MTSRTHVIGIAGIICSAIVVSLVISSPFVQGSSTSRVAPINNQVAPISEFPVRLIIPVLKVDAAIEQVGLTPTGLMGAPEGPDTVAWYNRGPRPGERGSAVIDGHSGWKDDVPAIFDTLSVLQKGDKIYTKDAKGVLTTFIVQETRIYDPKTDASDVFFSNDGKAHLNLITCEGVWDVVSKSSPQRLVIFSDKENEGSVISPYP